MEKPTKRSLTSLEMDEIFKSVKEQVIKDPTVDLRKFLKERGLPQKEISWLLERIATSAIFKMEQRKHGTS